MADQPHVDTDIKTRANLAYIWTGAVIILIGYTLVMYGHILAVLTLVIGFITGTASQVNSPYFGSPIAAKKAIETPTVTQTGENPVVTVTPNAEPK